MEPKGYTDKTAIENYLLSDIGSAFDTQLDSWIAGVENIIDQLTGRNFIADEEASERLYDGDGSDVLLVDDCIEVTKVEVGNDSYGGGFTEVPSTGANRYFLEPNNALAKKLPFFKITLSANAFTGGKQNNRVSAKWGYSEECPADISFAATVFVAGILNQQRQGGDQVKSEKIGNYSVTYNTDNGGDAWADFTQAKEILKKYERLNI